MADLVPLFNADVAGDAPAAGRLTEMLLCCCCFACILEFRVAPISPTPGVDEAGFGVGSAVPAVLASEWLIVDGST